MHSNRVRLEMRTIGVDRNARLQDEQTAIETVVVLFIKDREDMLDIALVRAAVAKLTGPADETCGEERKVPKRFQCITKELRRCITGPLFFQFCVTWIRT